MSQFKNIILISVFCFTFPKLGFSSILNHFSSQSKLVLLEKEVKHLNKKNIHLKDDIALLEKKLSNINKKYVKEIDIKNKRLANLDLIRSSFRALQRDKNSFLKKFKIFKLKYLLDSSQHKEEEIVDLVIDNFYKKQMKKYLSQLKKYNNRSKSINLNLQLLTDKISKQEQKIKTLDKLFSEWENAKQKKINDLLSFNKKIEQYKTKIILMSARKKKDKYSFNKTKFSWPLHKYLGLKFKKKGVTFSFDKRLKIKTPRRGVVSYVGTLSTYGKIIIINHNSKEKSILLGNFKPLVKEGENVAVNQVLGVTKPSQFGKRGKLYFEVRKNGLPQKTIELLNKI